MALPAKGTLGQIVAYNGYNYKWTGTSWLNIGAATTSTGNTTVNTAVTANGVSTGNTTSNTAITANGVSTGNTTASTAVTPTGVSTGNTTVNTAVTANGVTTGNTTASTAVTPTGVSTGNTTVSTSMTANGVSTGNTTASTAVSPTGISTGNAAVNTAVSANGVATGNSTSSTSVTTSGVTTGNTAASTAVSPTGISTGNTTVNTAVTANGVTTGNTVASTAVSPTGVSTGNTTVNTAVTANGISTGNTTIKTAVTSNGVSTGNSIANVTINSTAVSIGTAVINSTVYSGAANNALYLGNVAANQYLTRSNNQVINAVYTYTNTLNANVANFGGAVVISNNLTVTGSLTFSGTATVVDTQDVSVGNSIISLHSPDGLAPLVGNDARLIGLAYHYYDTVDKQALLTLNPSNGVLTYYKTSSDVFYGNPSGLDLGVIQAGSFYAGNNAVYSTVNATNYSGTANNALYFNGLAVNNFIDTVQIYDYLGLVYANAIHYTDLAIQAGGGGRGDATVAYSNAIMYVSSQGFVTQSYINNQGYTNASQLSANLANYPNVNFVLQAAATASDVAYANSIDTIAGFLANQPYVYFSDLTNYATSLAVTGNAATAYANAIAYVSNQHYVNTFTFNSVVNAYVTPIQLQANLVNYPNTNFVLESAAQAGATAYANAITYVTGQSGLATGAAIIANAATTYANAIQYVDSQGYIGFNDLNIILNGYANYSALVAAVNVAYTNAVAYVNNQHYVNTFTFNSVVNTYITPIQLQANLANYPNTNYVLTAASVAGDQAYANAITYITGQSGLATGTDIIANAATTYANAIQYVDSQGYIGFNDLNIILNNYANNNTLVAAVNVAYTNAIAYVANQHYVNTFTFNSVVNAYITPIQLEANLANYPNTSYVLTAASVAADLAYANAITYVTGQSGFITGSQLSSNIATTYANAIQYVDSQGYIGFNDLNIILNNYANNNALTAIAQIAYTNAVAYVANQHYVNTFTFNSVVNAYVTPIQLEANLANYPNTSYILTAASVAADLAYANAVQYTLSQTGGATSSAIIANAAAAYANAVAYVDEQGYVSTTGLYTALSSYSTTPQTISYIANQGFTNTSQVIAIVESRGVNTSQVATIVNGLGFVSAPQLDTILSNYPDAAYVLQISGGLAHDAFANATAYVDSKSYVNSAQLSANLDNYTTTSILPLIEANAATAYTNAIATVATAAQTAYTNAVAYVDGKSYVNASQLSTGLAGLINTSSNYTFTGIHTYSANLVINRSIILNGDSGIPGQVLTSNGSSNAYWSTLTGGGAGNIFDGGTPFSTYTNGPILDAGGVT